LEKLKLFSIVLVSAVIATAGNNSLKENLLKSSLNLKKTTDIQLSSYLSSKFKVSVNCPTEWYISKIDTVIKDTSVELTIQSEYGIAYVNSRSFSTTFDENISFLFNCLAINGDHNRFLKQVHNLYDTSKVIEMIAFKDTVENYNEELQSGVTFTMDDKLWAGFIFSIAKPHADQSITVFFLPQYYQQVDDLIKSINIYENPETKYIPISKRINSYDWTEKQINYNLMGKIIKGENVGSNIIIDHKRVKIQFNKY